jgi:hypothetical protein
VTYYVALPFV